MIYFATDFHLGVPTLEDSQRREKMLLEFLDSIKKNCEELFLMGDLFDFWYEYKTVIPKGHVRLLGKLIARALAFTPAACRSMTSMFSPSLSTAASQCISLQATTTFGHSRICRKRLAFRCIEIQK